MKIAVVVPCFKVANQLVNLVESIDDSVDMIFLIDDACPEQSVNHALSHLNDERIIAIFHDLNQGVGGAVVSGIKAALDHDVDIVIKLDGDAQYTPDLIAYLIKPVLVGEADCAKGNRFFFIDDLLEMPPIRIFGNAVLSFVNKASSGYWSIMDPTNGFIAWRADVLAKLPLDKLDNRYFFESDMLFRLNCLRAHVVDVPLKAVYADETSSLSIWQVVKDFPKKYLNRMFKRLFYNYFLRDFNIGSLFLMVGAFSSLAAMLYGLPKWYASIVSGVVAASGEVMLAAMLSSLGVVFLIAFMFFDVMNQPQRKIGGIYKHNKVIK
jgi:glycosyltransferase involved in cell wall biosynthesis